MPGAKGGTFRSLPYARLPPWLQPGFFFPVAYLYSMNYTRSMYAVEQSGTFKAWLNDLRDAMGRLRIAARLSMATEGNLGDCEPVGGGVHEMRVHVGPGYRLYFVHRGDRIIFLLMGGNKSTQRRDIKRAKEMAEALEKE